MEVTQWVYYRSRPMALYLVRHAQALSRSGWDGPDEERPLSSRGERQAESLVDLVAHPEVRRVLSSPALRCVTTVQPTAEKLGLDVRHAPELAEGAGGKSAVALMHELLAKKGDTVLCTHGDIIPEVLRIVARDDVRFGDELRWAKGSTWVFEAHGSTITEARYLPPPDR
jgi:8-oxo-dGTP diphosphatase